MNILIVKLSAIGDVIHTLPALNAIRRHYPDAHISWVVEEAAQSLVKGHRALDRVLVSKRKKWASAKELFTSSGLKSVKEAYSFIKELRDIEYDLIFDFHGLLKSGVLIGLARGKRKIGFDKGMEHQEHSYLFLNERVPPVDMDIHALMRNMMLLKTVGIPSDKIVYDVPVSVKDRNSIDTLLNLQGTNSNNPLIAINPMAKWDTKLWQNDRFAQLADKLIKNFNADIIFTGSQSDKDVIQDIMHKMEGKAINSAGKTTLTTLAALYERVNFLISTDTGPMHLAAAMGTPVVALFGPTAPWRTGPFGEGHKIIRADLDCNPCFKRQCKTINCMKMITVDEVLDGMSQYFKNILEGT